MKAISNGEKNPDFTFGIVTYIVRFDLFKNVFGKLRTAFPRNRIVVAVNGYYKAAEQKLFLSEMRDYLSVFRGVDLVAHTQPEGLCKLWNEIILASATERILICNDDIDISPDFPSALRSSGILSEQIAIINGSWSHFLISKGVVRRVGWFDERLYGVGGEDWDYEARLAFEGIRLADLPVKGITNYSIYTTDFSFGENIERVEKKYTLSSSRFLWRKWRMSEPGDPEARFVRIWNGHVRPNQGYETPVFYDFQRLNPAKEATGRPSGMDQ